MNSSTILLFRKFKIDNTGYPPFNTEVTFYFKKNKKRDCHKTNFKKINQITLRKIIDVNPCISSRTFLHQSLVFT